MNNQSILQSINARRDGDVFDTNEDLQYYFLKGTFSPIIKATIMYYLVETLSPVWGGTFIIYFWGFWWMSFGTIKNVQRITYCADTISTSQLFLIPLTMQTGAVFLKVYILLTIL